MLNIGSTGTRQRRGFIGWEIAYKNERVRHNHPPLTWNLAGGAWRPRELRCRPALGGNTWIQPASIAALRCSPKSLLLQRVQTAVLRCSPLYSLVVHIPHFASTARFLYPVGSSCCQTRFTMPVTGVVNAQHAQINAQLNGSRDNALRELIT